ncbi:DUF202 domain-containing protein [Pseudomonadota bacterium]
MKDEESKMNADPDSGAARSSPDSNREISLELSRKRTELAADRTDLSLIRTGFTASSFGAGLTQVVGRGVWSSFAVDLLTIVFILSGAVSVQIGLVRLRKRLRHATGREDIDRTVTRLLLIGMSLLQLAMLAIVIMIAVHM